MRRIFHKQILWAKNFIIIKICSDKQNNVCYNRYDIKIFKV